LIGTLKGNQIGNVYLTNSAGLGSDASYIYTVYSKADVICLKVLENYGQGIIFDGPISEFNPEKLEND
jgi:hypothetical protein